MGLTFHLPISQSYAHFKALNPRDLKKREVKRSPENCYCPTFYKVWLKERYSVFDICQTSARSTHWKQTNRKARWNIFFLRKNLVKTTTQWLWHTSLKGRKHCLFLTLMHPQHIEVAGILGALQNYLLNDCFGELASKWILGSRSQWTWEPREASMAFHPVFSPWEHLQKLTI